MLGKTEILNNSYKYMCKMTAVFMLLFGMLAMPIEPATAGSSGKQTKIEETLCNVIGKLTGPVGRGIGAIAVIIVGFSLFLGKVSWGLAIAIAIGIGAIFGAKEVVEVLGGGVSECT